MTRLPVLAVTLGDPSGIGPEIAVKAASDAQIRRSCVPLLVGDVRLVNIAAQRFVPGAVVRTVRLPLEEGVGEDLCVFDVPFGSNIEGYRLPDQGSSEAGAQAFEYLEAATNLTLRGHTDAVVTAPLNKEALSRVGHVGVGHTELLADFCSVSRNDVAMLLASERLRVAHVSTHVPLRTAIDTLSVERIVRVGVLAGDAVARVVKAPPRIAVAGLNPHAGEHGLFGSEETEIIEPAVLKLRSLGWQVAGPVAPDTVFARAVQGEFDAVVAMYHDQGHIPSKLLGFHDTVNVTLGLPIVRTSVDHGTAYDIAWTGAADEVNMKVAMRVAAQMVKRR